MLAHELSHHLGLHTVALTVAQWLSIPVLLLARIGFFLQNVASAATSSFASHSSALTAVGRSGGRRAHRRVVGLPRGALLSNSLANRGRPPASSTPACRRAVEMGFGRPLATALRRFVADFGTDRPVGAHARLAATHPPART